MTTFKHSLGYLSGLFVIGAASALIGCGGGGDASADGRNAADPDATGGSAAGTGGAAAAGSSANEAAGNANATGGSSSAGSAGTSAGGSSSGGSASTAKGGSSSTGTPDGPSLTGSDYTIDSYDTPEPTHPQPLLAAELTLAPRDEVSILAPVKSGTGFAATLDDAQENYAALKASAAALFAGATVADTASGNVDDDGNAELVAAVFVGSDLHVRVEDSTTIQGPQAQRQDELFTGVDDFVVPDAVGQTTSPFTHANVSLADVDQDGRDEILVTAVTTDGQVVARVYDDKLAGYELLAQPFLAKGKHIAATFGNFDDDAAPELAVLIDTGMNVDQAQNLELHVLDDASMSYPELKKVTGKDTGLVFTDNLTASDLKLMRGNFDDDVRDELVAVVDGYDSGENATGPQLNFVVFDDACGSSPCKEAKPGFAELPNTRTNQPAPDAWQAVVADTRVQLPDTSPDAGPTHGLVPKRDELFLVESADADNANGKDVRLFHYPFTTSGWTGASVVTIAASVASPVFAVTAAAGNLQNLASDVLVGVKTGTTLTPTRVWSAASGSGTPEKYGLASAALPAFTVASDSSPIFLTAGDFDADAMRVRYTGNKHQELMNPKPIAVVATPPVKAGINQDYGDSWTSYGATASEQQDSTTEYDVTDQITFSTDISPPIIGDFFGVTAEYSMSQQFGTTNTQTSMQSFTSTSTVYFPEDMVVFHGTLCEVYEYEIVSAAQSDALGTKITINEPIATDTYEWTVTDYNASLEAGELPIDATVITHTAGDPASYPSEPDASAPGVLWVSAPQTVGASLKIVQAASIDVATELANGGSTTTSSSAGGGSTGLVGIQYTQSWDQTDSYTFTVGQEFHYTGSVGGIDTADYQDWNYKFGLFVHNVTLTDKTNATRQLTLQVVDYYTDTSGRAAYEQAKP
ncbi:MAG TPA: hypothetical protein VMI54_15555 [Polyangiaceae bacterium]|nr:hypothetical protein [Polyangiaceae bacterium]